MDRFSGYNQIKMFSEDEKHTSFRTPFGVYYYTVMSFGLKNAGATYQRAMIKIFQDIQRKTVECYVDDLAVKSKKKDTHLDDPWKVFERLQMFKLYMNPLKCFLGYLRENSLDLQYAKEGSSLIQSKSRRYQRCLHQELLKNLEVYRVDWPTSGDSSLTYLGSAYISLF